LAGFLLGCHVATSLATHDLSICIFTYRFSCEPSLKMSRLEFMDEIKLITARHSRKIALQVRALADTGHECPLLVFIFVVVYY
jgi:hypothetical protein